MKTQTQRTCMVESAIAQLRRGIDMRSDSVILSAYHYLSDDSSFHWRGLEELHAEWRELVELSNQILVA